MILSARMRWASWATASQVKWQFTRPRRGQTKSPLPPPFNGGGLVTDGPDSPHLVLPAIGARLYFGHATNDRSMPEEAIEKLEGALQSWGGRYESEIYESAHHSWTVPDSPVYNQPQADRAFEKLTTLFAQTLR